VGGAHDDRARPRERLAPSRGHDTIVYVISGSVAIEFGEGGRQAVRAGAGDFLLIPRGLIHRESTPGEEPSRSVVIRAGGDGPPTIEVEGPTT
jgi:uncharacterized RmlC-like cupin family protein